MVILPRCVVAPPARSCIVFWSVRHWAWLGCAVSCSGAAWAQSNDAPPDLYLRSFEERVAYGRQHPWTASSAADATIRHGTSPTSGANAAAGVRERLPSGIGVFAAMPEGVGLAFHRTWGGAVRTEFAASTALAWFVAAPRLTVILPRAAVSPSLTVGLDGMLCGDAADAIIQRQVDTYLPNGHPVPARLSGTWLVAVTALAGADALAVVGTRAALHLYVRAGVLAEIARGGPGGHPSGQILVNRLVGLDAEAGLGVVFR